MFGRRRVRRVTVNIPAWIEVGNSTLFERCTLVDLTDKGAKLVVGDVSHLTDHFCLYLTRRGHLSQRCRIVWRRDHQIGVEFEGRDIPVPESIGPENAHQFENAARSELRRRVSALRGLRLFLMHILS
jgi:PilZ domain